LEQLHNIGIIHRDVKTQNVFLSGVKGRPKTWNAYVADLGLALQLSTLGKLWPARRGSYPIDAFKKPSYGVAGTFGLTIPGSSLLRGQSCTMNNLFNGYLNEKCKPAPPIASYDQFGLCNVVKRLVGTARYGSDIFPLKTAGRLFTERLRKAGQHQCGVTPADRYDDQQFRDQAGIDELFDSCHRSTSCEECVGFAAIGRFTGWHNCGWNKETKECHKAAGGTLDKLRFWRPKVRGQLRDLASCPSA
jgi:hypothetical protein